MIDAVILNRNLGHVCDSLYLHLEETGLVSTIAVIDCSTQEQYASQFASVHVNTHDVLKDGLRFGRGMNLGLRYLQDAPRRSQWTLLLPVDTEFVHLDIETMLSSIGMVRSVVAVKPLSHGSPFGELLGSRDLVVGWNFEEGPWLVRTDFVESQMAMNEDRSFFDESNFRGYLTSLDLAFRAYANGFGVGMTSAVIVNENESYLIERADLIATEPLEVNDRLLVNEGTQWLRSKYGIDDPWSFAMVVRSLYGRFVIEHPEVSPFLLNGVIHEN